MALAAASVADSAAVSHFPKRPPLRSLRGAQRFAQLSQTRPCPAQPLDPPAETRAWPPQWVAEECAVCAAGADGEPQCCINRPLAVVIGIALSATAFAGSASAECANAKVATAGVWVTTEVEPDVDSDGLGDESQDPDGGGLGSDWDDDWLEDCSSQSRRAARAAA
jgi:hypothetical protein